MNAPAMTESSALRRRLVMFKARTVGCSENSTSSKLIPEKLWWMGMFVGIILLLLMSPTRILLINSPGGISSGALCLRARGFAQENRTQTRKSDAKRWRMAVKYLFFFAFCKAREGWFFVPVSIPALPLLAPCRIRKVSAQQRSSVAPQKSITLSNMSKQERRCVP